MLQPRNTSLWNSISFDALIVVVKIDLYSYYLLAWLFFSCFVLWNSAEKNNISVLWFPKALSTAMGKRKVTDPLLIYKELVLITKASQVVERNNVNGNVWTQSWTSITIWNTLNKWYRYGYSMIWEATHSERDTLIFINSLISLVLYIDCVRSQFNLIGNATALKESTHMILRRKICQVLKYGLKAAVWARCHGIKS